MKKYKHKKTGVIYVEKRESPPDWRIAVRYYTREGIGVQYIPADIVEDSSDWEEVKEPIFITKDGVSITDLQQEVYLLSKKRYKTRQVNASYIVHNEGFPNTYLVFSSITAREDYVLENKPLLSVKDVAEYMFLNWQRAGVKFKEIEYFPTLLQFAKTKLNENY